MLTTIVTISTEDWGPLWRIILGEWVPHKFGRYCRNESHCLYCLLRGSFDGFEDYEFCFHAGESLNPKTSSIG